MPLTRLELPSTNVHSWCHSYAASAKYERTLPIQLLSQEILDEDRVAGQLTASEHERLAVGSQLIPVHAFVIEIRETLGLAPVERQTPQVGAVAGHRVGQEGLTVGSPAENRTSVKPLRFQLQLQFSRLERRDPDSG